MVRRTRSVSFLLLSMPALIAVLSVAPPMYAAQSSQSSDLMARVTATGIEAPAQATAGRVTVTIENALSDPIESFFVARLKPGATVDELRAGLATGKGDAFFPFIVESGGLFNIPPGARRQFVVTLPAGPYILGSSVSTFDLITTLIVPLALTPGTEATSPEPQADVGVTMQEFAFVMSKQLRAGPQIWKVVNAGTQPHKLSYVMLFPGKTVDDLLNADEDDPPPADVATFGGIPNTFPGQTAWIPAELRPGNYVALCFVTDPASGKLHAELGMIAEFSVIAADLPPLPDTGEVPAPVALPDTGRHQPFSVVMVALACLLLVMGGALRRHTFKT